MLFLEPEKIHKGWQLGEKKSLRRLLDGEIRKKMLRNIVLEDLLRVTLCPCSVHVKDPK